MTLEEAKSFMAILGAFTSLAELYDNDDIKVQVTKSSAAICLETPTSKMTMIKNDLNQVFRNESKNAQLVKYSKIIQREIVDNDLRIEFDFIDSSGSKVSIANDFKRSQKFYTKKNQRTRRISNLIFLNGELNELGGKNVNFHITTTDSDYAKTIDCDSKEEARRVRDFILSRVFISVEKSSTATSECYKFIDVYNTEIQYRKYQDFFNLIQSKGGVERYSTFHNVVFNELNQSVDTDVSLSLIRKYVRLFDNEHTEPGMLRTILVSLKAFKNEDILKDEFESIASRLRGLTSKEKI
jgi:hypothetical protein